MNQKVIVIGAGVAGMSAGIYLRMNGYDAEIYESHSLPGGVCSSWTRGGYTFDYCLHNLAGTGSKSVLHRMWMELGAFEGADINNEEMFCRVELPGGEGFNLYTDPERLERHLTEISPQDKRHSRKYVRNMKKMGKTDLFASTFEKGKGKLRMALKFPRIMKLAKTTLNQYAEGFEHPLLKKTFPHVQYNIDGGAVNLLISTMFLGAMSRGDMGAPVGGSLALVRRMEKRFTELGGKIHYHSSVDKILVKDNRAYGVRIKDGTEATADLILSAADGYSTIYQMLDGKYTDEFIDVYYRTPLERQDFALNVYLGVNRDMSSEPHLLTLILDKPLMIEGEPRDSLQVIIYSDRFGMCPAGKTCIKVETIGTYSIWKKMSGDYKIYRTEKQKLAASIIEVLEKRFPGITEQIEITDITTPVTVERFTHNYHGFQPWGHPTASMKVMMRSFTPTLPGLKNFHMTGHWAAGMIGISTVAEFSRSFVEKQCKRDGKKFKTFITGPQSTGQ